MRNRVLTAAAIAGAMAAVWTMPATLAGQASKAASVSKAVPRTADGKPDLTGIYDLATMTPVERAAGSPLILTDEQAEKLEQQAAKRVETLGAPIKGDRDAPPVGGDGSAGPAGNVGGYNNFWIDAGSRYSNVDGRKRASILIDPPDGRIPTVKPEARQRMTRNVRPTSDQSAREDDPGFEGGGAYDDPERRPLGERCLMGFGSTSGPPVLPNYFYNNLHQIVQTRDSVVILTEMVHDARIVRMNAEHAPPTIRKWMGDSIGRWEGDTLVVDTVGFNERFWFDRSGLPHTNQLRMVERFTRTDLDTLRYELTIDDPGAYTAPFTGRLVLLLEPGTELFEYVCQQSNYASELMVGDGTSVDRSSPIVP
jgi:hypothetical protein